MVERIIDGTAEVVISEALSPIIVSTWFGRATTDIAADYNRRLAALTARLRGRNEQIVMLADATASDAPSAEVRRAFSESMPESEIVIGTYVVIDNALVRGALTAIRWVLGDGFDVITCQSLSEGFELAVAKLEAAGIQPPSRRAIAAYQPPGRTPMAGTG